MATTETLIKAAVQISRILLWYFVGESEILTPTEHADGIASNWMVFYWDLLIKKKASFRCDQLRRGCEGGAKGVRRVQFGVGSSPGRTIIKEGT